MQGLARSDGLYQGLCVLSNGEYIGFYIGLLRNRLGFGGMFIVKLCSIIICREYS